MVETRELTDLRMGRSHPISNRCCFVCQRRWHKPLVDGDAVCIIRVSMRGINRENLVLECARVSETKIMMPSGVKVSRFGAGCLKLVMNARPI